MKLVSWNARGLGGLEKRREVRELVKEKRPYVLCVQETKLMACDGVLCASLWGDANMDYSYRPSVGASGGLLTVWNSTEVEVWSSFSQAHFLQIHGRFVQTNEEFFLFNIYAPCDYRGKKDLWTSLSVRVQL